MDTKSQDDICSPATMKFDNICQVLVSESESRKKSFQLLTHHCEPVFKYNTRENQQNKRQRSTKGSFNGSQCNTVRSKCMKGDQPALTTCSPYHTCLFHSCIQQIHIYFLDSPKKFSYKCYKIRFN